MTILRQNLFNNRWDTIISIPDATSITWHFCNKNNNLNLFAFCYKIYSRHPLVPNWRMRAPFESKLSLWLEASPVPLNIRNWHFKGNVITSDWIWSFRDFASFSLLGTVILVFSMGYISFWDHTKPTHFAFPLRQLVQYSQSGRTEQRSWKESMLFHCEGLC